jgi:threonine/homoserine/homoserine lactone efflux protein
MSVLTFRIPFARVRWVDWKCRYASRSAPVSAETWNHQHARRTVNRFGKGFLTAVLNPKGMMIYFAILPQFMTPGESSALQALLLSAIFIALCGLVYSVLSVVLAFTGSRANGLSDRRRRYVEGISGGIIILAAARLATT